MSETSEREREGDAFAESPAERIDVTARELFVREIERVGGVTAPLDDAAKLYARHAYELAAILEGARPDAVTRAPRPMEIGDTRPRWWRDARGVVTVCEDVHGTASGREP